MCNKRIQFIIKYIKINIALMIFSSCLKSQEYIHPQFKQLFSFGVEGLHYHYDETTSEHKKFMKLNGYGYGLNGAYQITYNEKLFLRPEARFVYGKVNYESYEGSVSKRREIPNFIAETRLLFGVQDVFSSSTGIHPYSGFGYRYKYDDSTNKNAADNRYGYKRINETFYIPIGSRITTGLNENWFLECMLEYERVFTNVWTYDMMIFCQRIVKDLKNATL